MDNQPVTERQMAYINDLIEQGFRSKRQGFRHLHSALSIELGDAKATANAGRFESWLREQATSKATASKLIDNLNSVDGMAELAMRFADSLQ